MQNRWRSYVLWVAIAALVGMGLMDAGVLGSLDKYNVYVEKVLYIAVLIGLINNPTDKEKL